MVDFGRDLKMLLRDNGCHYVRPADGSHEWWYSPITQRRFAVPFHIKSRHTANAVLKQAGLSKTF
jgi:predicted RNA binding protein YcfA (HicA-like mRNA interferase family)